MLVRSVVVLLVGVAAVALATSASPDAPQLIAYPYPGIGLESGIAYFELINGSGRASPDTKVHTWVEDGMIFFNYTAYDNYTYNPYADCNDPVFYDDVVEMFIAVDQGDVPKFYYEIDLAPTGALFFSYIHNPDDSCTNLQGTPLPCDTEGLDVSAFTTDYGWTAQVSMKPSILHQNLNTSSYVEEGKFKVGFFRVNRDEDGFTQYSCWNPTLTDPPCFHVPSKFGTLSVFPFDNEAKEHREAAEAKAKAHIAEALN